VEEMWEKSWRDRYGGRGEEKPRDGGRAQERVFAYGGEFLGAHGEKKKKR